MWGVADGAGAEAYAEAVLEPEKISTLAARYGIGEMLTRHVLVVDDEPGNLDVMEAFLAEDYIVHTAVSAERALTIIAEVRCDVVVTDQRMPGMTGTDLLAALREHQPDVAGILVTAYTDAPVLVDAINCALIFRYVRKPWEPAELLAAVAAASAFVRNGRLTTRLLALLTMGGDDLNDLLDHISRRR